MSQQRSTSSGNATRSLARTYGSTDNCDCPVHHDGDPATVPFGVPFADRLTVRELTLEEANRIYEEHHSYVGTCHNASLAHHGVYFDGDLVMALTYRYPLMSLFKVYCEPGIKPHRDDARARAHDHDKYVISGDRLVTISRICVAAGAGNGTTDSNSTRGDQTTRFDHNETKGGFPNLASAGMCASQEHFFDEDIPRLVAQDSIEDPPDLLITFIREDHSGSMIRALADKGWSQAGISEPRTSGNRDSGMKEHAKRRWLLETPYSTLR